MMTKYKDIESFLFKQLPMYQRVGPKAFKKDLSNINNLMELLDHPHRSFKSIHVAGTNGKGSTSFLLASALHAHGFKVGLYTSPHYKDYRERIKVNGEMIPKAYVKHFVNQLFTINAFEGNFKPSFFEITVAMAFSYFQQAQVDYAIIETGLGGRLDSTNVIIPILSVITNIGYDHTQFLGDTLEKIAIEKAGIIKKGIPVVIGRKQEETDAVFRGIAKKKQASLSYAGGLASQSMKGHFPELADYQKENMATAYAALEKLPLTQNKQRLVEAWTTGLRKWGYLGRYQLINVKPKTIADSAHNPMGIKNLMHQIKSETYNQLHIILAMVADKDLSKVLQLLPPEAYYYCSAAKIPRAMPADILAEALDEKFSKVRTYSTVRRALSAARRRASKSDLILIAGSVFTVAEVV